MTAIGPVPRLALTREEAAQACGMSLDSWERYCQPHVRMLRFGRLRLVPVRELEQFLNDTAQHTLEGRAAA